MPIHFPALAQLPLVGPRGLAANRLVCRILGALAAHGAKLDVVKEYGDAVVAKLVDLGVGLGNCYVPGRTKNVVSTWTMSGKRDIQLRVESGSWGTNEM